MSYEEKAVLAVFVFAAFMWITRTFIWQNILNIPGISDGMIAMTAVILLFLIPAKEEGETKLMDWKDAKDIPWGILILLGGGLAIAAGFTETGLSNWIGEDRKSTRLNSSHVAISYAVFYLKKKKDAVCLTESA